MHLIPNLNLCVVQAAGKIVTAGIRSKEARTKGCLPDLPLDHSRVDTQFAITLEEKKSRHLPRSHACLRDVKLLLKPFCPDFYLLSHTKVGMIPLSNDFVPIPTV
jgi:hypothetical protein